MRECAVRRHPLSFPHKRYRPTRPTEHDKPLIFELPPLAQMRLPTHRARRVGVSASPYRGSVSTEVDGHVSAASILPPLFHPTVGNEDGLLLVLAP